MKTWYAQAHCFSRMGQWKKRVKMDFPDDEKIEIVAALLSEACYFNKESAEITYEQYQDYVKAHPTLSLKEMIQDEEFDGPMFLREVLYEIGTSEAFPSHTEEDDIARSLSSRFKDDGGWVIAEEWNMGFALTKDKTLEYFVNSEPGDMIKGEW